MGSYGVGAVGNKVVADEEAAFSTEQVDLREWEDRVKIPVLLGSFDTCFDFAFK